MRFTNEINHNYKLCACPIGECMIVEDTRNGCSTCQKCGVVVADFYIDTEHEAFRSFEGEDNAMTSKEASFGSSTKVEVPSLAVPLKFDENAENDGGDVNMAKLLKSRASKEEIKMSKLEARIKSKAALFSLNQNITVNFLFISFRHLLTRIIKYFYLVFLHSHFNIIIGINNE